MHVARKQALNCSKIVMRLMDTTAQDSAKTIMYIRNTEIIIAQPAHAVIHKKTVRLKSVNMDVLMEHAILLLLAHKIHSVAQTDLQVINSAKMMMSIKILLPIPAIIQIPSKLIVALQSNLYLLKIVYMDVLMEYAIPLQTPAQIQMEEM